MSILCYPTIVIFALPFQLEEAIMATKLITRGEYASLNSKYHIETHKLYTERDVYKVYKHV